MICLVLFDAESCREWISVLELIGRRGGLEVFTVTELFDGEMCGFERTV